MKTTEELIEEFLAKGGKIEKLPPQEVEDTRKVGATTKKVPNLKTLPEAELLFGKKQVKRKKEKKPDYSNINMDLIPDHIKELLKVDETLSNNTKEERLETDQNSRSTKTSDEG